MPKKKHPKQVEVGMGPIPTAHLKNRGKHDIPREVLEASYTATAGAYFSVARLAWMLGPEVRWGKSNGDRKVVGVYITADGKSLAARVCGPTSRLTAPEDEFGKYGSGTANIILVIRFYQGEDPKWVQSVAELGEYLSRESDIVDAWQRINAKRAGPPKFSLRKAGPPAFRRVK